MSVRPASPPSAALLALTFALLAAPPPLRAASGREAIAIVHARIIDGTGRPPIADGTVLVRGGVIQAVGEAAEVRVPDGARLIEARGRSVLPGLADLHVHLTGGWDGVNTDFLSYQRYLDALLYAGVTTVLDVGNSQPFVLQLRQEAAQGRLRGPRIYCAGAMVDSGDPIWPDLAYGACTYDDIPRIVRRQKAAGVDLIKGYAGLSPRFLEKLAAEASAAGLRVVVDQWELNGSPDVVRTGIAGFAHLPTRPMPAEDVAVLKGSGMFVITTLAVTESFARTRLADLAFLGEPLIADTTPPWPIDDLRAMLGRPLGEKDKRDLGRYVREHQEALRNARLLHEAGVPIAAGTDSPYPGLFQGEGIHRELELLVSAGFTPLQAITAATRDAARILGAESIWGSLQKGRRADLILVDGNPAERIGDTRKIEMVMQGGAILDRASLRFDPSRGPIFRAVPGAMEE